MGLGQKIGSGIRPELSRVNYGQYLQGSQSGNAAMAAGVSAAAQGAGDYLKGQSDAKKEIAGAEALGKAVMKAYGPDSKEGAAAGQMLMGVSDEERSLRQRLGVAQQMKQGLSMIIGQQQQEFTNRMTERTVATGETNAETTATAAGNRATQLQRTWEDEQDAAAGSAAAMEEIARRDTNRQAPTNQQAPAPSGMTGAGAGRSGWEAGDAGEIPEGVPGEGAIQNPLLPTREEAPAGPPPGLNLAGRQAYWDDIWANKAKYSVEEITTTRMDPKTGEKLTITKEAEMKDGRPTGKVFGESVERGAYANVADQEKGMRSAAAYKEREQVRDTAAIGRTQLASMGTVIKLLDSGEVTTGLGTELGASIKRLGEFFGMKTNVSDFELTQSILGSEVMAQIGLTKGAVSEKEMAYFTKISANPAKTTEGNLLILRAKAKIMERSIREAAMINRWDADDVGFAKQRQMLQAERDKNPVLDDSMMKAIYGVEWDGMATEETEAVEVQSGNTDLRDLTRKLKR